MIASQSCNVQHDDFEKIPSIELIRATSIKSDEEQPKLAAGTNPRVLHTVARCDDGEVMGLVLKVEERVWVPRQLLLGWPPAKFRLEDSGEDARDRRKEIFAAWLGRSYTRVELPNSFNDLFKSTKLKEFFDKKLITPHANSIIGVYLEIRPAGDDSDTAYSATQIAQFDAPYYVVASVVVDGQEMLEIAENEVDGLREKRVPAGPGNKVSRLEAAKAAGLEMDIEVVSAEGWTIRNLMSTIRFTDWDYLSGVDETHNG